MFGRPGGSRTHKFERLLRPLRLPFRHGPILVGAPRFELGRSKGALCFTDRRDQPYSPDTQTFGGEPGNRTQSGITPWLISSELAYHPPRSPLAPGRGFEPRALGLEANCSPRSTPM